MLKPMTRAELNFLSEKVLKKTDKPGGIVGFKVTGVNFKYDKYFSDGSSKRDEIIETNLNSIIEYNLEAFLFNPETHCHSDYPYKTFNIKMSLAEYNEYVLNFLCRTQFLSPGYPSFNKDINSIYLIDRLTGLEHLYSTQCLFSTNILKYLAENNTDETHNYLLVPCIPISFGFNVPMPFGYTDGVNNVIIQSLSVIDVSPDYNFEVYYRSKD
jgi:hypothetical protein